MPNSLKRRCLFCDNQADSREHIIPKWILKKLDWGRGPFHLSFGKNAPIRLESPESKAMVVCSDCNHGWMHDLEYATEPILSPSMVSDLSVRLDIPQQYTLVKWAVKTAMIFDGASRRRPRCYEQEMSEALSSRGVVPPRTTIWLGRRVSQGGLLWAHGFVAHSKRRPGRSSRMRCDDYRRVRRSPSTHRCSHARKS